MQLFIFTLLLRVVSLVAGAAFPPSQRANSITATATLCAAPGTVTTTITLAVPTLITIVNPDYSSIDSSFSLVASIDTAQISDSLEYAPTAEPVPTSEPTFIHSIVVPGKTASEINNGNSSFYFVSIGPNATLWNYTPTQSFTIGYTTVTVAPVPFESSSSPVKPSDSTTYVFRTTVVTVVATSTHPPFTPYASGWNLTAKATAELAGPTGIGTENPTVITIILGPSVVTETTAITTITVDITVYNYTAYGYSPLTSSASPVSTGDEFGKRQGVSTSAGENCVMVYATIAGQLASWCNNWNGYTAVSVSSYVTTVYPTILSSSSPPAASVSLATLSVKPVPSSTPPRSNATSTTTLTVAVATTTVTDSVIAMSSTSSAPLATSSCGQDGNFEINFDDLPLYSPTNNDTISFPPIFSPYEHFFWGNGWAYGPPPTGPFPPQAGDHLGELIPSNENNQTASPDANLVPESAFGCGPRAYDNNFWFDAQSAFIGCDNGATDTSILCDFVATGYKWDDTRQEETVVVTEHFPQPPCPNFVDCHLQQIFFNSQFTQLSSLSFYANVQGQLKIFWVDTIELSWWNSTCAAGLNRISQE